MTRPAPRPSSLRWRLLAATVVVLVLALLPAGWVLSALFREHATQQFQQALQVQLDQLAAATLFDDTGAPVVDPARLTDPRWQRPLSGLYWQVDGPGRPGLLRSRSLWDSLVALPTDGVADGEVHAHAATGPGGSALLALERSIHDVRQPAVAWRLVVAGNTEALDAAVARFRGQLALSLFALFALLAVASWAQVAVGLKPLGALREALDALRGNRATRLDGRFPLEVQPLVDDFNGVLEQNAQVVERARQHAGNLAHALKTPLAVLQQTAEQMAREPAADVRTQAQARLVMEQVALARRHVDWHLARARSAAQLRAGRQATPVAPVLQGLLRVMERVHAGRGLSLRVDAMDPGLVFAGEEQDLQEMVGNLLDNACKWARGVVRVRAGTEVEQGRPMLRLEIEDDGPGIAAADLATLPDRGRRLDESVPGAGLGLAIVRDLAELHGGRLELGARPAGGLCATLTLPAAAAAG